jgi:hypothetical protein
MLIISATAAQKQLQTISQSSTTTKSSTIKGATMRTSRILITAPAIFGALFFASAANATIINFDDQGLTGPSLAASTTEANVTITAGGKTAVFHNGAILTAESALPADTTSLYYNSYFLPGTLGATMTVTFSANVSNFFLNLYNGETYTDSFTVSDNLGNTNTVSIAPNSASGLSLISFAAAGNVISITTTDTTGYDYSIDNIGFDQATPGVPEPATWAMFLLGFGAIGWTLRSGRRPQMA